MDCAGRVIDSRKREAALPLHRSLVRLDPEPKDAFLQEKSDVITGLVKNCLYSS